jgi:hypothetical protein
MSPHQWTTTRAATTLCLNPSRPRRRFLVVTRRSGGRRFLSLDQWDLAEMIPPGVMWGACLYCFLAGILVGWIFSRK